MARAVATSVAFLQERIRAAEQQLTERQAAALLRSPSSNPATMAAIQQMTAAVKPKRSLLKRSSGMRSAPDITPLRKQLDSEIAVMHCFMLDNGYLLPPLVRSPWINPHGEFTRFLHLFLWLLRRHRKEREGEQQGKAGCRRPASIASMAHRRKRCNAN